MYRYLRGVQGYDLAVPNKSQGKLSVDDMWPTFFIQTHNKIYLIKMS